MYDNCMFCQRPLGSNEVVEPFPVGRRLAFDEAKGRLWVVCPKCERWNLTPLEERWEAVEECERIFRDTRVRVSTENIGLCRHPEGLALVRIGKPLRPEFAAWRYGDQFGRRRRKAIAMGTLGAAAAGAIVLVGLVPTGIIGVAPWLTMEMVTQAKLRPDQGPLIKLSPNQLTQTRIGPAEGEPGFKVEIRHGGVLRGMRKKRRWFEGEEARRFAVALLPHINSGGGSTRRVRDAVAQIETAGTPQRFLSGAGDAAGEGFRYGFGGLPGYLHRMPTPDEARPRDGAPRGAGAAGARRRVVAAGAGVAGGGGDRRDLRQPLAARGVRGMGPEVPKFLRPARPTGGEAGGREHERGGFARG